MKGILLAGGTGSRLHPLTRAVNKSLLPVGREPMIYHPLKKLVAAGIKDICLVTGVEHCGQFIEALGSGKDFGCDFTYRVQDRPGGIAEALGLTRNFARDRVCVILGDNIFEDDLGPYIDHFLDQKRGARVLLKAVPDPERFGVAEIGPDGLIVSIKEKPRQPKSHYAVTGIYMYPERVFDIISELRPSARGELEVTDINNSFCQSGELEYDVLVGGWSDAGTPESLWRANEMVRG